MIRKHTFDMPFTPGFRIGVYEIVARIAAGGMGEVYRARDTVLERDVALKVLTRAASADPDRQARFEREARAVAALSHPNILAIYSFGNADGVAYAVIEWLEGHTLREELADGALPVRRVIEVGTQMALGLAAAHDKGIVHRDLKPENVFVTSSGLVKLLDFGLAKIASDVLSVATAETTIADPITSAGVVLGSVGYMSPEQVSGSAADHRSDVFSLGVVLFEMLTGHLAFRRASAVESWNATLKEAPPPMTTFTQDLPLALERIVMRCLEKSPPERFQSARDLAFALSALTTVSSALRVAGATLPHNPAHHHRPLIAGLMIGVALLAAGLLWPTHWAAAPHLPPLVEFTIPPPVGAEIANVPSKMLAISPDGDRIVFAATTAGHRELWIRQLASAKADRVPGTEDASEPFWAPDGQHIGFFAESKLKRVSLDGVMHQTICDAPLEARGAAWSQAGTILFSDAYGGLSRVPATGGVPARVTMPSRESRLESDSWPQFLPDGQRFLYLRQASPSIEVGATAYLGTLGESHRRELLTSVFNASFIPPNLLLFTDGAEIKVQRVDLERGHMVGEIEEVTADVDRHLGHAALAVSRTGTFAYAIAGARDHRLVWVDRAGREMAVVAPNDAWRDLTLSPDGSRVAVQRIVAQANDIWTIDLARGVPSRFTFSPDVDDDPVWSPDGTTIAFSSVRNGVPGIYRKRVSGAGDDELLFTNHASIHPSDWSPDGRFLLFEQVDSLSGSDVWVLPAQSDHTSRPYLATSFSESDAHFSPDGKWVAYTSDESGRQEVYVRSFPDPRDKIQVSTRGGMSPRWAPAGHELYFLSSERQLIAVPIMRATPLHVGPPTRLFDVSIDLGANRYVPSHDGKRFLLSLRTPESSATHLVVVLNWAAHLATTNAAR